MDNVSEQHHENYHSNVEGTESDEHVTTEGEEGVNSDSNYEPPPDVSNSEYSDSNNNITTDCDANDKVCEQNGNCDHENHHSEKSDSFNESEAKKVKFGSAFENCLKFIRCPHKPCLAKFKKKSQLKLHIQLEHANRKDESSESGTNSFPCTKCSKTFATASRLARHVKTHCDYPCKECDEVFKTWSDLRKHISQNHKKKPALRCSACRKKCADKSELRDHWKVCEKKSKFACQVCGKQFTRKSNLSVHVKTVHEKQKDFTCMNCGKTFLHAHNLLNHVTNCNGLNEQEVAKADTSTEQLFKCAGCSKTMQHKRSLWRHQKKCQLWIQMQRESGQSDIDRAQLGFNAGLEATSKVPIQSRTVQSPVINTVHENDRQLGNLEDPSLDDSISGSVSLEVLEKNQTVETNASIELLKPDLIKFYERRKHFSTV